MMALSYSLCMLSARMTSLYSVPGIVKVRFIKISVVRARLYVSL